MVSEQYIRDGAKQQDITMNYRFVGCLNSWTVFDCYEVADLSAR